jgi:hypothetical protein
MFFCVANFIYIAYSSTFAANSLILQTHDLKIYE